jgi:hypothetical protein
MTSASAALEALEQRRAHACRLAPELALGTVDDARAFLDDRGMLTLVPDCSLPSLFGACHEEPYAPGGRGFGSWPKTKWWWGGALAAQPGVFSVRLHRGKGLFLTEETAAYADLLCRGELARADEGTCGSEAQRLVQHLAEAGPAAIEEVKDELALAAKELRTLRTRLERVGAVVAMDLRVEAKSGGHRHTSELYRWDQIFPAMPTGPSGLEELFVAGLRAAVVAPEHEARSWFTWQVPAATLDALVEAGRVIRPAAGFIAAVETASARAPAAHSR